MDGYLRACSTTDGAVIWKADTALDYVTVNGVKASGGAINGPGPVVVNGVVYVNSGYHSIRSHRGNALLAYSVDGR